MIRLFVALGLPEATVERLSRLGQGLDGARWVEPRNLHLTLRFIGEVDEALAEEIHYGLLALRAEPFAMTLSGLGLFGDRHRAHTLWAGVERSEPLERLAMRIDSVVVRSGAKPEPKRFTPHVTLARIKEVSAARVQAFIAGCPPVGPETVEVTEFGLYRSTLGRHGPEYDLLERYSLGV